ncbi:MAG: hypothetical protein K6G06_01865 [Butyrivibrio sp.]|nr:hypothetical protein [Butyrivibrio sp.]
MDKKVRIRPDVAMASSFISTALIMLLCVVFYKITGKEGAGFLSAPISLFIIALCVFIFAFESVTKEMVRGRIRRGQMLNAKKNVRQFMLISFATGIVFAVIVAAFSKVISDYVFHSPRNFMVLVIMAPVFVFLSIQGVCRGYLSGAGFSFVSVVSNIILVVVTYACSLILSHLSYSYGMKVNALMHVDDIASAYGAVGAAVGISVGGLISLVFVIIVMLLRRNDLKSLADESAPVKLEHKNECIFDLAVNILLFATFGILLFLDQCVYMSIANKIHPSEDNVASWGIYFAQCAVMVSVVVFLTAVPFLKSWFGVHVAIAKKDYKAARGRLQKLVHFQAMLIFPVVLWIMVLAKTLTTIIFGKSDDAAINMIVYAIPVAIFGEIFLFQIFILRQLKNYMVLLFNVVIGIIVHVAVLLVMTIGFSMGIHASIAAFFGMFFVQAIIGYFELKFMLDYRQEFLRTIFLPFICAGISALITLAVDRIFVNLVGEILTLVVSILFAFISYMVLLIVLKSVNRYEVEKMPFGDQFALLSDKMSDR